MQKKDNNKRSTMPAGSGIAIGVALGVAIGTAMDNIGVGIAIGIAIGAAYESTTSNKRKSDSDQDDSS